MYWSLIFVLILCITSECFARSSKPLLLNDAIAAYRSFDTKLEFINDDEVQSSAAQIQREIEEINNSLWKKEQNEILTDADETDPLGYVCQKKIVEVKTLQYLDRILCTSTTGNMCFKTQQTSYASQYVKECKTHYKKACWVDMQDIFTTKKVTICTTRPENKCQRSIETGQNEKKVCKPFHETVCETRNIEKEIIEDRPKCEFVTKEINLNNGKVIKLPTKVCTNEKVKRLANIPNTLCNSFKKIVCITKSCPEITENKVCEDVEKVVRSQKPVEHCNLEPYESCNQVAKQYPYLEENEQCIEVPSENCVPNRIKPQLITRPIIKKSCTKMPEELFVSETMISELSVNRYDPDLNVDVCVQGSQKRIYKYNFRYHGQEIILTCFLGFVIVQLNHGKTQKIPGAFNATFEEYSQGIGEFKDGAYMIPLDVLHLLTSYHGFTMLQVRIGVYNGANQRAPEINFSDFKIGSKEEKYVIKDIQPIRKDSKQYFRPGTTFSTIDMDRDYLPNHHCAKLHGGGWWFSGDEDCGKSFLNGFNFKSEEDSKNVENPKLLSYWGEKNLQQSFMFISQPDDFDFF